MMMPERRLLAALVLGMGLWSAPALAQSNEADVDPDLAADACEMAGAHIIDAREVPVPGELASMVEAAGGTPVAIAGGHFNGEDFAPFAKQLAGACFYRTQLSSTRWADADMAGTRFVAVDMEGAKLAGARFDNVLFDGVNLKGGDLSGASLIKAEWRGNYWNSNLTGTRFRGANMRGFRFACQITMDMDCGAGEGADFAAADLTGANLSQLPIWGFDLFTGAVLKDSLLSPRAIGYLEGARLAGPILLPGGWDDDANPVNPIAITPEEFLTLQDANKAARGRDAPSFDCARASLLAETVICAEEQSVLRALDRELADLYAAARGKGLTKRGAQRAWLSKRNQCPDNAECIAALYADRIEGLSAALAPYWALKPGEERAFHEDVLPVDNAFRRSALFRRIVPALKAAALQDATLTADERGHIKAEGFALGANAHMCSLEVDKAVLDRASGWYGVIIEDGERSPLLRVRGDRLIFRFSGNMGDTPPEAEGYISCGMRAGFSEMVNLDSP